MPISRLSLAATLLALPLPALSAWSALHADPVQDPTRRGGAPPQAQDPDEKKGDEKTPEGGARDIFGRPLDSARPSAPRQRLLGCWQLIDLSIDGFPSEGRTGQGLLLVEESFLAFELHLSWGEGTAAFDVHQTFIAEYQLNTDGTLQVNTVIGSFLNDVTGELEWERAGFPRQYTVVQSDRRLTLEFGAGDRMVFAPRAPQLGKERDIFGRKVRETTEERDVYGRPVRREKKSGDGR